MNDVQSFRAMSGSVDTAGGFGVPVLIDPTIILTAQGSLNPFRRLARVETITTDAWNGVSSAGVTWAYSAEGAAYTDNSPTLAQPTVAIHEAKGFIPFTIRVAQDYPGFADEMSRLLMEGYDELQANKFATGSGSGEPYGILTALAANTNVTVHLTSNGSLVGTDVNKVWGALPDRYKANATWVMNEGVANDFASLANNNNYSNFTVDLTGQVEKIRNRPVEFSSYFPSALTSATAANVAVVGDFRNYLIADRVGMTVELVPHLFTNNMPTSQRGWVAYARNGADSINDLGFRLLANS
jgi:HK97 family phage major capsid protein